MRQRSALVSWEGNLWVVSIVLISRHSNYSTEWWNHQRRGSAYKGPKARHGCHRLAMDKTACPSLRQCSMHQGQRSTHSRCNRKFVSVPINHIRFIWIKSDGKIKTKKNSKVRDGSGFFKKKLQCCMKKKIKCNLHVLQNVQLSIKSLRSIHFPCVVLVVVGLCWHNRLGTRETVRHEYDWLASARVQ